VNLTDEQVDVFVPDERLFGTKVVNLTPGEAEDHEVHVVKAPARYPYAVFSYAARDFVAGESSPEIIVDR
jgi:hypothetical protein